MRTISEITREIRREWRKPYFGAVPYLDAMSYLGGPNDYYGMDPAREIVLYFLGNAQTWRGPVAKRVKAELKEMFAL